MDLVGLHRKIYLDNASTTRISENVLTAMLPYLTENYANPSSAHSAGRAARVVINSAREQIARVIGAHPHEIYFTSGGSESDNWAVKGIGQLYADEPVHIITTVIEHHAILNALKSLEKVGFDVTYIDVDRDGFVAPDAVERAIRSDTALISVMFANNETGAVQPIASIGDIAKRHNILFHTDAVQAFGHLPIDVDKMNIDMLSFSGHKFNAPKGVGGLYVRHGIHLPNLIDGGNQEGGWRSGTENVASIVGMGVAAQEAVDQMDVENKRLSVLRERLLCGLLKYIPDCKRNTPEYNTLPGIANISIGSVEAESVVLMLDLNGICASAGAACMTGSSTPSHVLLAMGLDDEAARGSVRFSFDKYTTENDIDTVLDILPNIVKQLRDMSHL